MIKNVSNFVKSLKLSINFYMILLKMNKCKFTKFVKCNFSELYKKVSTVITVFDTNLPQLTRNRKVMKKKLKSKADKMYLC